MKVEIISFILLFSLLFGAVVPVEGKLTENGKKWIAEKFGVKMDDKYCYSYDSPIFYWYDPDEKIERTDKGTAGALAVLLTAHLVGKEDEVYVRIGDKKYYYSDLKAGNDGYDITLDDVKYGIVPYDGHPAGENQYCYSPTAPPPTPEEKGYLTEECKQYIARYLGEKVGDKYCFTDSTAKKVKYWTPTDEEILGSTVDAVNSIVFLGAYSYEDPVNKIGKITADTLKQKNGGNALTNDDIVWIANHSDGANKYCYTPTTTGKSMLTENGKRWIAQNFGKKIGDKYCFVSSGLSWVTVTTTGERLTESGGTSQIVGRLVLTSVTKHIEISGKVYTYNDLKSANDGNDVTLDDAKWIADHDGYPAGESQYCYAPETPTPTPTQSPTPAISQTTETITKTTPSTPGFEAILTAIIILLVLVTKRY